MAQQQSKEEELIHGLMNDITGGDLVMSKDELSNTISNILKKYNLSTDLSFVEKIATMKFPDSNEKLSLDMLPKELTDAAFLPVTTIADIALRQDLDLVVSQIPEWYNALIVSRDAICEADTVDGTLARTIVFDKTNMNEVEQETTMSKIEAVEDKLKLHSIIKNHVVYNTLFYGEGYLYAIPYAKVFEDLYKYRLHASEKRDPRNSVASMFENSSSLMGYGYGYGESAIEVSLKDTIIQESAKTKGKKQKVTMEEASLFTEAEIIECAPGYHSKPLNHEDKEFRDQYDNEIDYYLESVAKNIHYIEEDVALPVIEESAHDLKRAYDLKYKDTKFVQESNTVFETVMANDGVIDSSNISKEFQNIKGVYLKILPATKLIPIRIDRTVIGYYYISDLTRPDESGERKNSGLSGYTLRSPSVGHDTFSPDRLFCEKIASKIVNNFNLKFMRDNASLHQQIVAILEAHKFNEAMMRFIYIPAEHVCQCTINEDGAGKGHSMLEGGLITARMYMFLKLYSLLFQINNSAIRVYNLRSSGIDKNYKQFVQQTMRKFAARRVTTNDIFNYRSSMTKVSGGSELIMPTGANNEPPINIETIPASEAPINNEFMDNLRAEAINSTPVPAIMVQNGGVTEIEFSKETELANTRFTSFISSCKIDFNRDITRLYRVVLRWETDIDPEILQDLKFMFRMPSAKTLSITADMISNFEAFYELMSKVLMTKEEQNGGGDQEDPQSPIMREFKKGLIAKYLPSIDVEECEKIANEARKAANVTKLKETIPEKNLIDDADVPEEGEEEV
jgi:hypothetical protein